MGIIYEKIQGFDCKEDLDGYVIYDDCRDLVHYLNLTAAPVFELCDGKSDVAAIADILQEAYGLPVPPTADVEECLASLQSKGLVSPRGPSSAT